MGFYSTTILKETRSENRKRLDTEVLVKPLLGEKYTLSIRILSQLPISADTEDIVDEVIRLKKEWKECKRSCSITLAKFGVNAYILNSDKVPVNSSETQPAYTEPVSLSDILPEDTPNLIQ